MIDGMLIDAQKAVIEDYALAKLCRDEMSYDEFVDLYNNLLRENGVAFSEKLFFTDEWEKEYEVYKYGAFKKCYARSDRCRCTWCAV